MEEIIRKVEAWAEEKGLLKPENQFAQFTKCFEEWQEFKEAPIEDTEEAGDVFVTLIILARQIGEDFAKIYEIAETVADARYFHSQPIDALEIDLYHHFGKLAEALGKNKKVDARIALINIAAVGKIEAWRRCGVIPEFALRLAYDKISKRKGRTVDGRFIKESDLK